jgi:hypothetical protein
MLCSLLLAAAMIATSPQIVASVSSPLNDYNFSTDAADRTLVVARSQAEFRNARILVATRRRAGDRWSALRPIAFSDPRWSDSDPWLTPDGRSLYFISTRPAPGREEGRADYDIWRSHRIGGGWSTPEHLGPAVNSRGQELGPELHGGILYFSSGRRSGKGGLDIYRAAAAGAGFAPPAVLEGPVNTAASESDFTLRHDGRAALFWRSGEGGNAAIHISYRTAGGWSEPRPLPAAINHGPFNFTPSFTRDGRALTYASTKARPGQEAGLADIYRAPLPATDEARR